MKMTKANLCIPGSELESLLVLLITSLAGLVRSGARQILNDPGGAQKGSNYKKKKKRKKKKEKGKRKRKKEVPFNFVVCLDEVK